MAGIVTPKSFRGDPDETALSAEDRKILIIATEHVESCISNSNGYAVTVLFNWKEFGHHKVHMQVLAVLAKKYRDAGWTVKFSMVSPEFLLCPGPYLNLS